MRQNAGVKGIDKGRLEDFMEGVGVRESRTRKLARSRWAGYGKAWKENG